MAVVVPTTRLVDTINLPLTHHIPLQEMRVHLVGRPEAPPAPAQCDTGALERNMELGRRHRVQGTPAVVFEDGSRAPGAIPVDEVERRLVAAAGKN